ncbi:MAG: hypothetical protein RIT25_211 [Planctomycetota bacterium]|jgi:hypothetical protein
MDLSSPPAGSPASDPLANTAEVALRLMAGMVPRKTLQSVQRMAVESTGEYPWRAVHEAVLADPVDPQELLRRGLLAERDWVARGGRETPGPGLKRRAKGFVAKVLAQLIVFAITLALAVVVLLLVKYRWPEMDVYRVLEMVRPFLPDGTGR